MPRFCSPGLMWSLAALEGARLAWGLRQLAALDVIPPREPSPARTYPSLSIIVPARNEEKNIGPCLDRIRAQTYPGLQIVVVDDRSEDRTGAIVREVAAADSRVRYVEGQALPDGWVGKCWALHQGARAAQGDWLLFVDADTRLKPGAATGAVEAAERRSAAVLSAITAQDLPTVWERAVQPAVFAALAEAMPVTLVNDPNLPQFAIANGQFLLARRDAYDAIGGHEAIKAEIAEDAQFAKRTKALGWRFWLASGRELASTRMYETPGALWEGWTKNLHVGARLLPWLVPPGIVLLATTLVSPYLALYCGLRKHSKLLLGAGLTQLAVSLTMRRVIDRTFDVPPVYVLAQPLGQLAFLALLVASFYKVATGKGVTWKGRRYYR